MTRRGFVICVSALIIISGVARAAPVKSRPNVIIVLTDDMGYGELGVHGNRHIKTPNLDAFATQGVQFTRYHTAPMCAPTRASLMTGRYPYRTGVLHTSRGGAKMHGDEVTLAELLRDAGYATGIFGKWHLGDNYPMRPQEQGFSEVLTMRAGGLVQPPDLPNSYFDPYLWRNGQRVRMTGYCTDIFFNEAIRFLEAQRDHPFFVYLPTNAVHEPLQVSSTYSDPYKLMGLPDTVAKIYGMVQNIDENFGRLIRRLDDLKLRDKTLVLFLTDDGPSVSDNRYRAGMRGGKGTTYEAGIRVPFFLQYPAGFKGRRKIDPICADIDILPTVLDICSVRNGAGRQIDGSSLKSRLESSSPNSSDRTLFFQCHRGLSPARYLNCAALTQRFKMVGYSSDRSVHNSLEREELKLRGEPVLELYDLETDPGEHQDLAKTHPEVLARLRAGYDAWFDDMKNARNFTPGFIHIGNPGQNPSYLSRYMDAAHPRNNIPTGWPVVIERSGRYEVTINRGSADKESQLFVNWQGQTKSAPLVAAHSSAVFQLTSGTGLLEVWFEENGQKPLFQRDLTLIGDVELLWLAPK